MEHHHQLSTSVCLLLMSKYLQNSLSGLGAVVASVAAVALAVMAVVSVVSLGL